MLGALAAAPLGLLGVGGSDAAGQGDGADGAPGHLSAGHLLLDGWRRGHLAGESKKSGGGGDMPGEGGSYLRGPR